MRCVLCAARGHDTTSDRHICDPCVIRIGYTLDDIVAHALAASVEPVTDWAGIRGVPGSKPPINLDGVDPALTLVDMDGESVPVLEVLESWERLVRAERGMVPYGPASATRGGRDTTATLTGVTAFLRASLDWWATRPDLPVEDLDRETRLCARAMRHHDRDRPTGGWRVPCPTIGDDGDCGWPITVYRVAPDEHAPCRRCGRVWDTDRLLAVAGRDADVFVDPEAASTATGVPIRTIQRWGATQVVRRDRGRYSLADIRTVATRRRDACG